jgi:hypothetical protein
MTERKQGRDAKAIFRYPALHGIDFGKLDEKQGHKKNLRGGIAGF